MVFVSSNTLITYALLFRDIALTVLTVVTLFLSILWVSVFLYGSFYFLYMPTQTYEIPLNFKFDPCDSKDAVIGVKCSFLQTQISFAPTEDPSNVFHLLPGQSYEVSLELVMPQTRNNQNIGMFMTCITLKDEEDTDIQTKCLSSIMEHRSYIAYLIRTFLTYPFKIFSGGKEKSVVSIDFYNNFQDNVHRPTRGAAFEIQSRFIDIYEAKLRIHAHFTGLRYLMYYYPVASSCLGASLIGIVVSSVLAVTWKRFFDPVVVVKVDSFSDKRERAKAALQKSSGQMKVLQRVQSLKDTSLATQTDFVQLEQFVDDIQEGIHFIAEEVQNESDEVSQIRQRNLHQE